MSIINLFKDVLGKVITPESMKNDIIARNQGSQILAFSSDYSPTESHQQIANHSNSVSFLEDKDGSCHQEYEIFHSMKTNDSRNSMIGVGLMFEAFSRVSLISDTIDEYGSTSSLLWRIVSILFL